MRETDGQREKARDRRRHGQGGEGAVCVFGGGGGGEPWEVDEVEGGCPVHKLSISATQACPRVELDVPWGQRVRGAGQHESVMHRHARGQ